MPKQTDFVCYILRAFEEWPITDLIPDLSEFLRDGDLFAFWHSAHEQNLDIVPPSNGVLASRALSEAALGRQLGSKGSKKFVAQLIPEGLGPWGHMKCAKELAHDCSFSNMFPAADEFDLAFAARWTLSNHDVLRSKRTRMSRVLRRISVKLKPLSAYLRQRQHPCVARVAGSVHVAFIAFLCWCMKWPDILLAKRFITGFAVVGQSEITGTLPPNVHADCITKERLFRQHTEKLAEWRKRPPDEHADVLIACAVKDRDAGVA